MASKLERELFDYSRPGLGKRIKRRALPYVLLLAAPFAYAQQPAAVQPTIDTAVNAASFTDNLGPGGFVTLNGAGLSPCTKVADTNPMPEEMCQTGVTLMPGARRLRLHYVSPLQINALLPEDLRPGWYDIYVSNNGAMSRAKTAEVKECAPEFFMMPSGFVAGQEWPEYSLITARNPAKPGDVLVFYGTSFSRDENQGLRTPDVYLNGKGIKVLGAGKDAVYQGLDIAGVQLNGNEIGAMETGIKYLAACYSGRYCSQGAEVPFARAGVRTIGGRVLQDGKPIECKFTLRFNGAEVPVTTTNKGNYIAEIPR